MRMDRYMIEAARVASRSEEEWFNTLVSVQKDTDRAVEDWTSLNSEFFVDMYEELGQTLGAVVAE